MLPPLIIVDTVCELVPSIVLLPVTSDGFTVEAVTVVLSFGAGLTVVKKHGQSVTVKVVGAVTVYVLPFVTISVGSGQYVVNSLTTVVSVTNLVAGLVVVNVHGQSVIVKVVGAVTV